MIPVLADRIHCTGCLACMDACQHGAISAVANAEGFLFPTVDATRCVGCGRCERVCRQAHEGSRPHSEIGYAARTRDADLLKASASGGVFSELASRVIADGGIVYGCAFDEHLIAKHVEISDADGLRALCGSKYVQSDLRGIYACVKKRLDDGLSVLFSGTPCQVAALNSYLGKSYERLLCVALICHGVPSPGLFDLLKHDLQTAHGKLKSISFRDKANGWTCKNITGFYADGPISETGALNDYFRSFLSRLSIRKCCETCSVNAGKSGADITLGDFWGVDNFVPRMNDGRGVSAVIVHTHKGKDAFLSLGCDVELSSVQAICQWNPSYKIARKAHDKRDQFMHDAFVVGISKAYTRATYVNVFVRLFRKGRCNVVRALGFLKRKVS